MWWCIFVMISVIGGMYTTDAIIPGCPEICRCDNFIVNCQNNNLLEIPSGIDSNIISLDLSINRLRNISQDLKNFKNLKYLNMSHNQIETLGHSEFESMENLERLDLTFNLLRDWKDIHSEAFTSLGKLVFLDMSNNPLRGIPQFSKHFHINSLEILKLNNCSMESISVSAFSDSQSLKELHMTNNPVRVINGSFTSSTLRYIDLSNSLLVHIGEDLFETSSVLETLVLTNNAKLRKLT
ncbi:hypothetical protein JTB14_011875 [Gonioctena quinquepunctata]|nr:hypothetical protein JTB14_011875 [Gonioctena quinquepunctata]